MYVQTSGGTWSELLGTQIYSQIGNVVKLVFNESISIVQEDRKFETLDSDFLAHSQKIKEKKVKINY